MIFFYNKESLSEIRPSKFRKSVGPEKNPNAPTRFPQNFDGRILLNDSLFAVNENPEFLFLHFLFGAAKWKV